MNSRPAVVVDAYSGSVEYARGFRSRGVPVIGVLSTPEPLPVFVKAWHPEEFDRVLYHDGDFEALVAALDAEEPLCVVPGNESAVELTEALCEVLTPDAGNVPGLTAARRDKWQMAQRLAKAGVPHIRQLCSDDPDEIARWLRESGLEGKRLVLKPPKSGGTDAVYFCEAGEDWRPHFDVLCGAVNRFGVRNAGVLVQEFAKGVEFVVDTYSVDGRHGLTDVLEYRKRTRGSRLGLYERVVFVPRDDPRLPVLVDYAMHVLDVLGIRNGAAHAEVMLTDDGPRLVEVAARLAGTPVQQSARFATGDCQIDRAVRRHLDGTFTPDYELRQHVTIWMLASHSAGVLRDGSSVQGLRDLPTVVDAGLPYDTGDTLPATEDLFTLLGWLVLASPDRAAIERDYSVIQTVERDLPVDPVDGAAHDAAEHATKTAGGVT
jgi:hypothetical protein